MWPSSITYYFDVSNTVFVKVFIVRTFEIRMHNYTYCKISKTLFLERATISVVPVVSHSHLAPTIVLHLVVHLVVHLIVHHGPIVVVVLHH